MVGGQTSGYRVLLGTKLCRWLVRVPIAAGLLATASETLVAAGAVSGDGSVESTVEDEARQSPLESDVLPDPPLLANVIFPLVLHNWSPRLEDLDAARAELDLDGEEPATPKISVRMGPAKREDSEDCIARRSRFLLGWKDEVPPGVIASGPTWYRYLETAADLPEIAIELDYGDGELEQYSTSSSGGERLCFLGSGYWQTEQGRLDGLHLVTTDAMEFALQLVRGSLPADLRHAMTEQLMYPLDEPDPDGILTMINEAVDFPILLRASG